MKSRFSVTSLLTLFVASLLVLFTLFLTESKPALALDPEEIPQIAFLDNRDQKVNLGNEELELTIDTIIRNNTQNQSANVTLLLEGLSPDMVTWTPDTKVIEKLQFKNFQIKLNFDKRPKTNTYSGVLVAISNFGDIIRKNLTLVVTSPQVEDYGKIPFVADNLETLTFKGTNILPSVINPLRSFLITIGSILLLLFVALVFGYYISGLKIRTIIKQRFGYLIPLFCVGFISLALGVCIWLEILPDIKPDATRIVPVSVNTIEEEEKIGYVVGNLNELGLIIQNGAQLEVNGIHGAGEYKGKIELPGNETSLKTEVFVSDAWGWAVLIIIMGVGIGFFITTYYANRDSEKIKREAARIWEYVIERISQIQARTFEVNKDTKLKDSVGKTIITWFDEFKKDDINKSYDDKKKILDELKDSIDTFKTNLDSLEGITNEFASVKSILLNVINNIYKLLNIKDSLQLRWMEKYQNTLDNSYYFDLEYGEGKGKEWSEEHSKCINNLVKNMVPTKEMLGILKEVEEKLADIIKNFGDVEKIPENYKYYFVWIHNLVKKIPDLAINELEGHNRILRAWLRQISTLDIKETAKTQGDKSISPGTVEIGVNMETPDVLIVESIKVKSIDVVPLRPEWFEEGELRTKNNGWIKDYFQISVKFESPPTSTERYFWDFGDNTKPEKVVVSGLSALTHHVFVTSGTYEVRIFNSMDDETLACCNVTIDTPSYWERIQNILKMNDLQVALLVAFITIGSGFTTLYYKNPYWGSYQDYLIAFLWGSIGSQGLKLVSNIVSKVLPTG